jgi:hypothetical protein
MTWIHPRGGWLAATLALAAGGLLALLPPEQTLGGVVRVIFLHGALVQVGLLLFGMAGLLALGYLLRRSPSLYRWVVAAQRAAVVVWVLYALASMLSTYLAWGQWIAWDEPRVRASAAVLWFTLACLAVVEWAGAPLLTALANGVQAVVVWSVIKGASLFRHPFDPIGTSGSTTYRLIYAALLGVVLLLALFLVEWLRPHAKHPAS